MKTAHKNARRPRYRGRQAYLSPDPCEKISNYLNIWRIAVSSERPLPCPLKPREMQEGAKRDAASVTKVNPPAVWIEAQVGEASRSRAGDVIENSFAISAQPWRPSRPKAFRLVVVALCRTQNVYRLNARGTFVLCKVLISK